MIEWAALPKVELHLHLEGAAPPEFIRQLAAEKAIDLGGIFRPDGGYAWRDFAEFLRTYEAACAVLRSPDDYRRLTAAVLGRSAANGVIYAEIFVAPDLCGDDPAAWPDYLAAIAEGAAEVPAVTARFIATAIRHFGPERAVEAALATVANPHPALTGFGMAGEERFGAPTDYARAFAIAGEAGLGLTVHAGEICGADSVAAALSLAVTRIGHGVRAIEDPDLVARLADRGTVLEVCPGSNIALGLFPDWPSHPVARLRAAGVPVTLSTDDPPYFHTTLAAEYERLAAAFGWTEQDFAAINRTAIAAAFCDPATRARILSRLDPA